MMERVPVRSTDIAIIGYDPEEKILEVAFRTGKVYHYTGVPSETHSAFLEADSKGIFFRDQIRERFDSRQVRP